jgi:hypothetical protein
LVALWQSGTAPWTLTQPLTLGSGASVRSTAVDTAGDVAVLVGGRTGGVPGAVEVRPAGQWNQLPRLPAQTAALAMPASVLAPSGSEIDAFTVAGNSLGVYSLGASDKGWARVQSTQIPLAYGSSG